MRKSELNSDKMKKYFHLKLMIVLITSMVITFSCKEEIDWEAKEIEDIEEFLTKQGLDISPESSGLYYKDVTVGTGEVAHALDTVEVYYSGFYLNGIKFDSNIGDTEPFRFVVWDISSGIIDGFHEAMTFMKEGGEAFVIIPSWLAYGTSGNRGIPGYTPLIFELEMVKIYRGPGTK